MAVQGTQTAFPVRDLIFHNTYSQILKILFGLYICQHHSLRRSREESEYDFCRVGEESRNTAHLDSVFYLFSGVYCLGILAYHGYTNQKY